MSDATPLAGDLALPNDAIAAAVICHPHPQYGGDRFNTMVAALYDALPAAGIAALRFDFRSEFGDGIGERLDALAALDELERSAPGVPMAAVGYSFGAWIALGLTDDRIRSVVAIAPPLAVMALPPISAVPTLILTPAHDQFSDPSVTEPIVDDWRSQTGAPIEFEALANADHFLTGHTASIAARVTTWLTPTSRNVPGA